MPAVDDPFGVAASLPGQVAKVRQDLKDLAANNTQAASAAAASATSAAASATSAAAAANAAATTAANASVTAAVGHNSASGYALTTSAQELTRVTMTVPAGYTQALIFGTASMTVIDLNSTLGDYIRGYIDINGVNGPVSGGTAVQSNFAVGVTVSYSYLYQGLAGGASFYVRAIYYNEFGNTGAGHARNICNLDTMVTFLH